MITRLASQLSNRLVLLAALCALPCSRVSQANEQVILEAPVRVVTSDDPAIFPMSWREPSIHASGAALPQSQFDRVASILKRAFQKYPDQVLRKHLKIVYVLSDLRYSSVSAGGTNSRNAVYLKIGNDSMRFTDEWAERVFHAEFSSILLRNLKREFDSEAWSKLAPADFEYNKDDGVGAIKQGQASTRLDESLYESGFLDQYAKSSLENDFNAFAAGLFTGNQELWNAAEKHQKIQAKRDLTIRFYHTVDPAFTEQSFRELISK